MGKALLMPLIMSSLFLSSGCSFMVPHTQTLTVRAEPSDATIYINGHEAGTGVVSKEVRRNQTASILATHPGYKPQTQEVHKVFSATGIVDAIGGLVILLPAIGLASPGAYELKQSTVVVVLEKED